MRAVIKEWTNIKDFPYFLDSELRNAMELATELLTSEVKENTPVGATSAARGGTRPEVFVRGKKYMGVVGNEVSYIEPLEEGSKPHWAPIAPLEYWSKRILGDESIAYAIQKKIAEYGTLGAHMFSNAEHDKASEIKDILRNAVHRAERRIK